jgi:asparagine synthase (glutamine-hydrolysing)
MEPAMRTLEEPPTGLAALAQYRIFQACREHDVTVVLDGEGSDEILAGYPYQHRLLLMDRLRRGRLVDFAHELRAVAAHREQGTLEVVVQDFAGPALRRLARGRPEAPTWIAPAFRSTEGDGERAARRDKGCDPSWLNQDLYFSLTWGNMKIILPYTDKTAMAHSVEARVPYFDRALVEFAFSLPDHYKAGGGQGKRILRDAVRQRLPPAIVERRGRMGFATPDLAFLRGPLKATLRDAVSEGNLLAGNCFVKSEATRFLDDFEAGRHQDFRGVWRMYALASWSRAFGAALP